MRRISWSVWWPGPQVFLLVSQLKTREKMAPWDTGPLGTLLITYLPR
jgi:hypothetical protein